jgi:hypothetical protein
MGQRRQRDLKHRLREEGTVREEGTWGTEGCCILFFPFNISSKFRARVRSRDVALHRCLNLEKTLEGEDFQFRINVDC